MAPTKVKSQILKLRKEAFGETLKSRIESLRKESFDSTEVGDEVNVNGQKGTVVDHDKEKDAVLVQHTEQEGSNDSEVNEPAVPMKDIIDFFRANPNPNDSIVHDFASKKGFEPDDVEEAIYKLATVVANFKHMDDADSDFDPNELSMGIEVETEHTDNKDIAAVIAKAHLAEIPDYYTRLKKMEEEGKAANSKKEEMSFIGKPGFVATVDDFGVIHVTFNGKPYKKIDKFKGKPDQAAHYLKGFGYKGE